MVGHVWLIAASKRSDPPFFPIRRFFSGLEPGRLYEFEKGRRILERLFALGQLVRLKSRTGLPAKTPEAFRITGFMPPQHVANQYRIRSEEERYERVVEEDDLELIEQPDSGEAEVA